MLLLRTLCPETERTSREWVIDIESVSLSNWLCTYRISSECDIPDTERVIDGLSFEVESGELIAFVGTSGAGKSTIVSLPTRMYESNTSQITVSGTPFQQFGLEQWRDRLSVIRKYTNMFNDEL